MKKTVLTASQSVHVNFDKGWVANIWLSMEDFDKVEELLERFKKTRSITDAIDVCDIIIKATEDN